MTVLLYVVCDGVSGHVKEQEVLLLRGEDSLLHQVLGQTFPHVLQLVPAHTELTVSLAIQMRIIKCRSKQTDL